MNLLDELKNSRVPKKVIKLLLLGLMIIIFGFFALLLILIVAAYFFHDQIYNILVNITNFVFGESPDNFFKQMIQQILNNYLKGLFKGEN